MFETFKKPDQSDWIRQVTKELGDKPLESIYWQLNDDLSIAPLFTLEDLAETTAPISRREPGNSWEIGEAFLFTDPATSNREALEGLSGGAEALLFQFRRQPKADDLNGLFKDIELAYISTHFDLSFPGKDPAACYRTVREWLSANGKAGKGIRGSIDFDPLLDWSEPPLEEAAGLIKRAHAEEPGISVLQVNARIFHTGTAGLPRELALTVAKGLEYMARLTDLGLSPETVNAQMQFSIAVGTSYFGEIAKIRALRLLWGRILENYSLDPSLMPPVVAHFSLESLEEDPLQNMIRAATQAMSAVIGGVDRLYIPPANAGVPEPPTPFTRRVARNVHHILKMESFLDRVADPGAGSYYIEKLTDTLAESAWSQLQEIERAGGFMVFDELV